MLDYSHPDGTCLGLPEPNLALLGVIRSWLRERGQDLPPRWMMTAVDERFARYCADVHENSQNAPDDLRTRESYAALTVKIQGQMKAFSQAGYTILFWTHPGQPYANGAQLRRNVPIRERRSHLH